MISGNDLTKAFLIGCNRIMVLMVLTQVVSLSLENGLTMPQTSESFLLRKNNNMFESVCNKEKSIAYTCFFLQNHIVAVLNMSQDTVECTITNIVHCPMLISKPIKLKVHTT